MAIGGYSGSPHLEIATGAKMLYQNTFLLILDSTIMTLSVKQKAIKTFYEAHEALQRQSIGATKAV
jgi:hypothetical protein